MSYEFLNVYSCDDHYKTLYKMLAERKFHISHQTMPEFRSHIEFVASKPYRTWFFIKYFEEYIGNFYIQEDNSIAINIESDHYENGIQATIKYINTNFSPRESVKSKIPKEFFINLPFEDKNYQDILYKIGLKPAQISYKLNKKSDY